MMKAVKKGGDRQELHERLREHAVAAAAVVKQEGKPNDMIARVEADPAFGLTREEIEAELCLSIQVTPLVALQSVRSGVLYRVCWFV